ncbi:ABC transporter ATP-binding protein [Humisphaera borealis]|nr:ABC transporter ATP-binding protein [Humisphaera borealis]
MQTPLLEIRDLNIGFDTSRGQVRPVRDVSYTVFPGQTLAVVGESGCGKSVTALSILRLIPEPPGQVLGGQILLNGRDLLALSEKEMRSVRGREIAMIFQEPMTSLNPVYTIGDQIVEAVTLHQHVGTKEAYAIAEKALNDVGIADAHRRLNEYPHQMSGGMRQRVMIAMALSCQPKLLIADEPTTALDVTIQAQILELLQKLQRERGMSIVLITHDLGVVAENADVVAVMYASRVVEYAKVEELFDNPLHPYTEGLFLSVPKLGESHDRLNTIRGTVPNPASFPTGCKFHTRCARTCEKAAAATPSDVVSITVEGEPVKVLRRCTVDEPTLRQIAPSHWAACHQLDGYDKAPAPRPSLTHRRESEANFVDVGGGDVRAGQTAIPYAKEAAK